MGSRSKGDAQASDIDCDIMISGTKILVVDVRGRLNRRPLGEIEFSRPLHKVSFQSLDIQEGESHQEMLWRVIQNLGQLDIDRMYIEYTLSCARS